MKRMICIHCKGESVLLDAWAEWDKDAQEWVLENTYHAAHCNDCQGATTIQETEVEE